MVANLYDTVVRTGPHSRADVVVDALVAESEEFGVTVVCAVPAAAIVK